MVFCTNVNEWQNQNVLATIDYRAVGLSQPTYIPPGPFSNYSDRSSNDTLPQPPAVGTPFKNTPAVFENAGVPTLRYSPAVPATQQGHKTQLHSGTDPLTTPPMA